MTDNDFRLKFILMDRTFDLLGTAIRIGAPCWAIVAITNSVAGQETIVNVAIKYFEEGGNLLPWSLATGTGVWAFVERKLRHRKVAHMSQQLKDVEIRLDPNRTSSGLTDTGETPSNPHSGGPHG